MSYSKQPGPLNSFLWTSIDSDYVPQAAARRSGPIGTHYPQNPRQSLTLGGRVNKESLAQYLRGIGLGMKDAFWADIDWFEGAVRDLHQNLQIIDQAVLQKHLWTQFLSEIVQELYQSGMKDFSDRVTRDCIVNDQSSLQCASTTFINVGLFGLNAMDPLTYLKATCIGYVKLLQKNGAIDDAKAKTLRDEIEVAFFLHDVKKAGELLSDLRSAVNKLSEARIRLDGGLDRRVKQVIEMEGRLREGLVEAAKNLAKIVENDQKKRE